jgi:hypothetical protein
MVVRRSAFVGILLCLLFAGPARAQRAWQAPEALGVTAEYLDSAVAANGELLVAWVENFTTPAAWRLRAQVNGAAVTLTERSSHVFSTAVADDGSAVVAWTESPAEYGGIPRVLAAYRPAGGAFEAPVELGSGAWALPVVASANARGDFIVAFDDQSRLMAAMKPVGGAFEPAVAVDEAGTASSIDAAVDRQGHPVIAWSRGEGASATLYTLYATSGTDLEHLLPATKLTPAVESMPWPSLAVDGQGRAIVGWGERAAGAVNGTVRAATGSSTGGWNEPFTLDEGVRSSPALGVSPAGDVVAAWTTFVASDANGSGSIGPVRVRSGRIDDGFGPSTDYSKSPLPPSVAVGADGTAIVTYGDWNYELHTVRRQGTAPFGPIQTAVCPAPHATPVLAGLDAAGTATLLYHGGNHPANPWQVVRDAPAAAPSPSFCSLGPVTRPPAPKPPSGTPPVSAPTPTKGTLGFRRARLGNVLKNGLRVTSRINTAGPATLTLLMAGKPVAQAKYTRAAGVSKTTVLKLKKSAAKKLRKAKKVKLGLVLARNGTPVKTLSLTLRR